MSNTEPSPTGYQTEIDAQHYVEVTVDGQELRRKIGAVAALVEEFRMHFEPDGLRIETIDTSHVCTVRTTISGDYETDYAECTVGLNADNFKQVVSFLEPDPEVTLRATDGSDDLSVSTGQYIDYEYVVDPTALQEDPDEWDLPFEHSATVDGMTFKGAIAGVGAGADGLIRFTVQSDVLLVEGGAGWTTGEFPYGWELKAETEGGGESTYSFSYLQDIAAALDPARDVTLRFDDHEPVRIEQDDIAFELAPRLPKSDLYGDKDAEEHA